MAIIAPNSADESPCRRFYGGDRSLGGTGFRVGVFSEVVMSTMLDFSLENEVVAPFYMSCIAMLEPV